MSAVISHCEQYRYSLKRSIADRGFRVSVFMVNPSTADAIENDATIRKLIGFGQRLGWREITVANLFAYRATDVSEIATAGDPIGPHNNGYILAAMLSTDISVVAWGASAKLPASLRDRWRIVPQIAQVIERPLWCFGTCADGHPKHPVMIAYASMLETWKPPL